MPQSEFPTAAAQGALAIETRADRDDELISIIAAGVSLLLLSITPENKREKLATPYVFVGIGSLVLNDVPDNTTVVGRPAIEISKFRKQRQRLMEIVEDSS